MELLLDRLTKQYGSKIAVDCVSATLKPGVYGLLGANGAGNVNLSGGGDGFNMAAMMASMAVGGAVGQNIAGSMNNMMAGMNQPVQNGMTPPPVPGVTYYVVVNGQATGPYDLSTLKQMIATGQFTSESFPSKKLFL